MDEQSFREVVSTGTRREQLEALRDVLAVNLETAPHSAVAGISRELQSVLRELESLVTTREGSKVDELARRRKERRATATD